MSERSVLMKSVTMKSTVFTVSKFRSYQEADKKISNNVYHNKSPENESYGNCAKFRGSGLRPQCEFNELFQT